MFSTSLERSEAGKCLRGSDGRLSFIEDKAKIWKEHTEKIINEENEWDHIVETDVVEPVEKAARNEKDEIRKGNWTSEVSVEMIVASGEIGVKVMMELCQRILDGK